MFYLSLEMNHSEVMVNMDEVLYFTPDNENTGSIIYMPRHTLFVSNSFEELRDKVTKRQGYVGYNVGH